VVHTHSKSAHTDKIHFRKSRGEERETVMSQHSKSERAERFRERFLSRGGRGEEENDENNDVFSSRRATKTTTTTFAAHKRERIRLYEKRFRNEEEEDEEEDETNSSLFGSFFAGWRKRNYYSARSSNASPSTGASSSSSLSFKGSRRIGNFHKYGSSSPRGSNGDFDDASTMTTTTPRSVGSSGTKSSVSLAGIEEDDWETMQNTNENVKKKSSLRPTAAASSSSPGRESDGKAVTFGLPRTMSVKEQKQYERKREKEMSKYLEETTKALYSEEELSQNDDDKMRAVFRSIDGGAYYGCVPRMTVVFAMISFSSFGFGGVSYALFDPRGNAKVFGDLENEDEGNDNAFRAIALFGAVLGAIMCGFLSDHAIGRKIMLSLSAGTAATLWSFFFGVSNSNASLCDAPPFVPVLFACMCGMTCASWYSVAPVLLAETAPAQIRGRAITLCISLASILGAFMIGEIVKVIQPDDGSSHKFYVVVFVLVFMAACMGMFVAVIESPRWLLSKGRVIDAQHSCAKISDSNAVESLQEMQSIKIDLDRTSPEGSTSRFCWYDLVSKNKFFSATIVCSCLIMIQTFGTSSFYMFTSDETEEAVNEAYLYAYFSMLVGILICAYRVDEGRKSLLVTSFFILALANSVRFIVSVVDDDNYQGGSDDERDGSDVKTSVTVVCNCFGAFGYGVGAASLPLLFATEWFPQHARQTAVAYIVAFWYGIFLLASITEETTMALLGDIIVFLAKAIICVMGIFVALFAVHETPSLTLEMAHVKHLESSCHGNLLRDDDDDDEACAADIEKARREKAYDASTNSLSFAASAQSFRAMKGITFF